MRSARYDNPPTAGPRANLGATFIASSARSKLFATELIQRFINREIEILGFYGLIEREKEIKKWVPLRGIIPVLYRAAPGATIAGVTSQNQRNTLASELGLPPYLEGES